LMAVLYKKHIRDILKSARNVAQTILSKRAEMDAQGRQHNPLFVFQGENHVCATHRLHHLAVLRLLQAAGIPVAVCLEHSMTNGNIEDRDNDKLSSHPVTHDLETYPYAPITQKYLFNALGRSDLPVKLTDAKKIYRGRWVIDPHSKTAVHAFALAAQLDPHLSLRRNLGLTLSAGLHPQSREGMAVRNAHMLGLALEFGRHHGARIVAQICGDRHIAGGQWGLADASLAGMAGIYGLDYVGVSIGARPVDPIPNQRDNLILNIALPEMISDARHSPAMQEEDGYVSYIAPRISHAVSRALRRRAA
jgi:hypothetical protein